jgi:carbon monoxide dehydrogenase subunit G
MTQLPIAIKSSDGDLKGEFKIDLSAPDESTTRIVFSTSLEALGSFKMIVNQIIERQLDKFVNQFVDCISYLPLNG